MYGFKKLKTNAYATYRRLSDYITDPSTNKDENIKFWIETTKDRANVEGLKGHIETKFRLRVTYHGTDFLDIAANKEKEKKQTKEEINQDIEPTHKLKAYL